ncbi:hypothetical protein JTE90_008022 [Oedothorax gibbosus]|uniref:Uncharacterized protein n=1 Tax=Oedothorax gibbosus TaxID=931172 RepID=A0AAV6UVT2_9ARAC|nr:hypothetical protein JTE90_008022 [Oedothorax gibbosus]
MSLLFNQVDVSLFVWLPRPTSLPIGLEVVLLWLDRIISELQESQPPRKRINYFRPMKDSVRLLPVCSVIDIGCSMLGTTFPLICQVVCYDILGALPLLMPPPPSKYQAIWDDLVRWGPDIFQRGQ